MAKISFDDIKDKEKGKIGIICGLGGSLRQYHNEFAELSRTKKEEICFISCNEWNLKTKIDIDYWVIASSIQTIETNVDEFNELNKTLIYAYSADGTDPEFVKNNLNINYLPYDERHVKGQECNPKISCCNRIIPNTKTIQEYLGDYLNITSELYDNTCGTVAIHMLAVAIILGCNPIYISGVDMNYATGYVDNSELINITGGLIECARSFEKHASIINEFANRKNIKIIQLSSQAYYNAFEHGTFKI